MGRTTVINVILGGLAVAVIIAMLLWYNIPRNEAEDIRTEFIVLRQIWPPSFCNIFALPCDNMKKDLLIGGLWPMENSTYPRKKCGKSAPQFSISLIGNLQPKLEIEWADSFLANGSSNAAQWEREWLKHGSCAYFDQIINNLNSYFMNALRLKSEADTLSKLQQANIFPANQRILTAKTLNDTLFDIYGKRVVFTCAGSDYILLKEVFICYDKSLRLINCPDSFTGVNIFNSENDRMDATSYQSMVCPKTFVFPEFPDLYLIY